MPEFKNREEYEALKARKIKETQERLNKSSEQINKPSKPEPEPDPPKKEPTTEKKCPHCAMMIPKEANICPYCKKQQLTPKKFLCAIVVLIGFVFFTYLVGNQSTNKQEYIPESKGPDKIEACVLSREMVKEVLKAPSTAKFGNCNALITDDEIVIITSYVDAQNSFGAMLRNNYAWHAKYDKYTKKWDVIYFALAGNKYINKYNQ